VSLEQQTATITVVVQNDGSQTAHAITFDSGPASVTVCGYPAERLTVLRKLSWDEVPPDKRCAPCDAEMTIPKPSQPPEPVPLPEPRPTEPARVSH
jgi:hypothetical protein